MPVAPATCRNLVWDAGGYYGWLLYNCTLLLKLPYIVQAPRLRSTKAGLHRNFCGLWPGVTIMPARVAQYFCWMLGVSKSFYPPFHQWLRHSLILQVAYRLRPNLVGGFCWPEDTLAHIAFFAAGPAPSLDLGLPGIYMDPWDLSRVVWVLCHCRLEAAGHREIKGSPLGHWDTGGQWQWHWLTSIHTFHGYMSLLQWQCISCWAQSLRSDIGNVAIKMPAPSFVSFMEAMSIIMDEYFKLWLERCQKAVYCQWLAHLVRQPLLWHHHVQNAALNHYLIWPTFYPPA